MKKTLILLVTTFLIFGCKNSTSKSTDIKNDIPVGIPTVISQDTYDRDNYSLILAGIRMHKEDRINLLAIDVTGQDPNDRGGLIFSTLLEDQDVPILINQDPNLNTRRAPASQLYSSLIGGDDLLDSQRQDSTLGLAEVLESSLEPVNYIVGGHLHNLASLMKYDIELVRNKIKTVVIYMGWRNRSTFDVEMNLSEGLYKNSGTAEATRYVFRNMPDEVKIIISNDPDQAKQTLDIDATDEKLNYLLVNGSYSNKPVNLGDFASMMYVIDENKTSFTEVQTCYRVSDKHGGIATTSGCLKNHWYMDNVNTDAQKEILSSYIK